MVPRPGPERNRVFSVIDSAAPMTTMTPLSVYLPFNMDCLRGEFEPAKRGGGGPRAGTGRWLIVQDQKLLVVPEGDGFCLPAGATPEAPPRGVDGLGPRHWLGTWAGEPCWVAALPKARRCRRGSGRKRSCPCRARGCRTIC